VTRVLLLCWVDDGAWLDVLQSALEADGGCVAIICSTVGRAQEVFQKLKYSPHFVEDELGLFHVRFLFIDREEIEGNCIIRFGKPSDSKTDRPHRYILVATQVIEQSLDLDFDLMISDLAPVDLLLQRSGRLHRHEERTNRPVKFIQPTLWLITPAVDDQGKVDFGDSGFIYDRHVLLRTWLTLRDRTTISLPATMDNLIETVYNLDILPPENLEPSHIQDWQGSLEKHRQDQASYRSLAQKVYLPSARGKHKPCEFTKKREEDDDNTITAVTRLGDESVTTIFLEKTASGWTLPKGAGSVLDLRKNPNLPLTKALLANSTRISKKGLVQKLQKKRDDTSNPDRPNKQWKSSLLKYCCYVELDSEGKAQIGKWEILLDPSRGVIISSID